MWYIIMYKSNNNKTNYIIYIIWKYFGSSNNIIKCTLGQIVNSEISGHIIGYQCTCYLMFYMSLNLILPIYYFSAAVTLLLDISLL